MKQTINASQKEAFYNREILSKWFQAQRERYKWEDYRALNEFKREYPEPYKTLSKVGRLRSEISNDLMAMESTGSDVYFGTLTFNADKNRNKIETKRKEAFKKLQSVFKYVLLVEELGGVNGRYHIHFLAAFIKDRDFNDFRSLWHSRQNLVKLSDNKVVGYLANYVVKQLPRLHRNTMLVHLRKKYDQVKHEEFMSQVYRTPIEDLETAYDQYFDFDEFVEATLVKPIV